MHTMQERKKTHSMKTEVGLYKFCDKSATFGIAPNPPLQV